ncbi:MAG: MATE family efflux transporter [Clostridia bacterium]|nr:MATE family efflux transporter [Clostridia bacterium]MBR6573449.1 MATE family efflux transporter [Clostridia bacterium]
MSDTRNMTRGKPLGLLITFALPLMFGNIFQQLYTVVDTAIVGRGVGMDALAALGTVDWLNWMLLGLATGLAQGFSVRVSQKFGEGDLPGMRRVIGQSAFLSALIALVCTLLAQLGIPLFLWLLRVPADLVPMARLYIRILFAGFPAVMFFNLCAAVLRAVGDSKTPLIAMAAASLTNIALDAIAVFVLDLGIGGAAAATVLSQCLSGTICALRIWRSPDLRFTREDLRPQRELSASLLRLGLPIGGKNVILSLGGIGLQSIVNGFGTGFIAGYTATNKLYGLLEIAALSYCYAVTTYVGQNYGAGEHDRIRKGMKSALGLFLCTALVLAVLMFAFGRPITGLFLSADDPQLLAEAADVAYTYFRVMAVCLPILYLLYLYQAGLQGLGQTGIGMVVGVVELVLRITFALFSAGIHWPFGLFVAEVSAWWGGGLIFLVSYYRAARKLLR